MNCIREGTVIHKLAKDWMPWLSGECPVPPDSFVQVITASGEIQGMLDGKRVRRCAQIQAQAYQNAFNPMWSAQQQAQTLDKLTDAQFAAFAKIETDANAPPPDTLASWFTRLERRANQLIDDGEFMDTVEWMRWREELDRWQDGR